MRRQPAGEPRLIADPVAVAELVGPRAAAVGRSACARSSVIEICEPNPAASRRAYSHRIRPALRQVERPELGIGLPVVGTGGTMPVSSAFTATTSSMPTPMGWPVKPFVLAMTTRSASAPNTRRKREDLGRRAPPRAGV